MFNDIAVADLGAVKLQLHTGQEALQAEIGHDGGNHAAAGQTAVLVPGFGDQRHDLIAIDDHAILVDDDNAIGIAVQRDADVGPNLVDLLLQLGRMGGAAFLVDVEAVRLDIDGDNVGTEFPERGGRDLVASAVGAIDDDAQTRQ